MKFPCFKIVDGVVVVMSLSSTKVKTTFCEEETEKLLFWNVKEGPFQLQP